jgi:AcrR family transcriptional regulator
VDRKVSRAQALPRPLQLRRERGARLPRADRMDGILDAAQAVFCEKGYEATAVAEVAARLGVVEGTVFRYFPTKRELLLKVLERWYLRMADDYAADLAGIEGAAARLRLLVYRHLRSLREQPQLCRLMFREVRSGGDYHGSRLHELNRRYAGLLTAAIEQGVASGEFRGDVPAALLRDLVYGGIEHHAWNWLEGRGRLDVEGVTRQLMAVLQDGIAAGAAPRGGHGTQSRLRARSAK